MGHFPRDAHTVRNLVRRQQTSASRRLALVRYLGQQRSTLRCLPERMGRPQKPPLRPPEQVVQHRNKMLVQGRESYNRAGLATVDENTILVTRTPMSEPMADRHAYAAAGMRPTALYRRLTVTHAAAAGKPGPELISDPLSPSAWPCAGC